MPVVTRFVLAHKRWVVAFWLIVLVGGIGAAQGLNNRLSQQVSVPGAAGYEANQQILQQYGNGGPGFPEVVVVTLPSGVAGDSPAGADALRRGSAALAALPGVRVADYGNTADRKFLTSNPQVSYGLVFVPYRGEATPSQAPQITAALQPVLPPGSRVQITGTNELKTGGETANGVGVLIQTLSAAVAALVVLILVFGSALAVVPLLMAAVAIPGTFLAVYALTGITDVFFVIQPLVALIGLGLAIDYSLLLVTRWREEMAAGYDSEQAVGRAMLTAGRSIAFSGITVAIGLLTLVVIPVPLVRSIGFGGMLIPAISVAVTLTLLPVVLAKAGQRLDWPHRRRSTAASRIWTSWIRLVIRRRWIATAVAVAVLGVLGVTATGIKVGQPSAAALSTTSQDAQTLRTLNGAGVPDGVLNPIEVMVPDSADTGALVAQLAALPGVRTAHAPEGAAWRHDGTALISIQPVGEPSTASGDDTLRRVEDAVKSVPGAKVGGPGALLLAENHAFYGRFALMLGVLSLVTFLLLARAFGSLVLPIKAIILNFAAVGATYGILVFVWQNGHGAKAIWNLPATGSITNWVPLMAFAFLYGLSMDYEVFILTRVREERDRTGSTDEGIVEGIGRTGRLVTSAALILFLAMAALTAGPQTDVKVMATALGAGILLDATIVRALLVPALVSLMGDWNWWMPRRAARLGLVAASIPRPANEDDVSGRTAAGDLRK